MTERGKVESEKIQPRDARKTLAGSRIPPPELNRSGSGTEKPPPKAPAGAKPAGKRLWADVVSKWTLDEHELLLLGQACRVADTCAALQLVVDADGPLIDGRAHPALVELRAQQLLLARLIVALRVPLGDQADDDGGADRLQRRGLRGVYGLRGGAA